MKRYVPLLAVGASFLALMLFSAEAAEGARRGLTVCAATLVPSLFPFFVLARLLSALGLPDLLAGTAGNAVGRLFGVSGSGVQAFFIGLSGGYPLGASVVAQLRRDGRVGRDEAERLLAFCNNSGPAFILGAAGGVLGSPAAGLLLYITHALSAVCVGLLLRPRSKAAPGPAGTETPAPAVSFGEAFPAAVTGAVAATLNVCGNVILFSALLGMLAPLRTLPPPANALAAGLWELGSGVAALAGQPVTPETLASAALLLGWGGLSVHAQTLGAVQGTDISCARHLAGRALCGVIAAVFTYAAAYLLF